MEQIAELPLVFRRAKKIGVVLDFAIFDHATGSEAEFVTAVPQVLGGRFNVDGERLRTLGFRPIRKQKFLGDWYDREAKALIKVGDWCTDDERELHNPLLKTLDRVRVISGARPAPESGAGGDFAYAFSQPPYSL